MAQQLTLLPVSVPLVDSGRRMDAHWYSFLSDRFALLGFSGLSIDDVSATVTANKVTTDAAAVRLADLEVLQAFSA